MSVEPESWEDFEETVPKQQLSNLNINASEFVPNVFAQPFVPKFGGAVFTPPQQQQQQQQQTNGHQVPVKQPEIVDDNKQAEEPEVKPVAKEPAVTNEKPAPVAAPPPQPKPTEPAPEQVKPKRATKPKVKRKDNINIVFIGHVDAGKSTIGGHLLYLTGQVDKRTLEKFEKEAKEMNRESWYLSWALDTNDEERDKGKTVEVGRGFFETENKRFTLLDAPGHRCFVSNMIGGAAQADVGVLVISARKGEFETGFDRGGQTREHAMLAKTAGVKKLIVLINKMDDPSVEWDPERYNEIKNRLSPFLKQCNFNPKSDLIFMPASGLTGANLKQPLDPKVCPWYTGPTFLKYLDDLPCFQRTSDGPFRLSVVEKYKDMGTMVMGKIISGTVTKNQTLTIMPNKDSVQVMDILIDDEESDWAESGDNVKLKLKNIEEEDISAGFVLCSPDNLCRIADTVLVQIQIVELKNIIAPGFNCIMHIHSAIQEVSFKELVCSLDKKTGKRKMDPRTQTPIRPRCAKEGDVVYAKLQLSSAICIEAFSDYQQMGRFVLREEGKTIAIGKVLKISEKLNSVSTN